MSILDSIRRKPDESADLREELKRTRWQGELVQENLRALETAAEAREWRQLGAQLQRDFTRGGLDDLMDLSRAMYLSHPLIQRAVNITTYYTWGQGVEFSSENDSVMEKLVNPMVKDPHNKAELYGHQARLLTDVDQLVDGNVFIALFHEMTPCQLRSVPAEEIRQIHRNPDDRNEVWFYRREWSALKLDVATGRETTEHRVELHPDIGFQPASKADTIGGHKVRWDAPIIHQKVGGLKQMRFGIPATYAALDWARAYRKFLEDWHTIVSSLARFAWRVSTKGSKVDRLKRRMGTAQASGELSETGEGASPPAGSVWLGTEEDQLTPIPKTGAHTSSEDARPSRLMVGAAMDLPDTILSGDADVGNLATAKTLDRPTELAMSSRQAMWGDFHQTLFGAAAVWSRESFENMPDPGELVVVSFPPILEHDQEATVRALVSAATLDGKLEAGTIPHDELAKRLMQAVGVEDVDEALKDLPEEDQQAVEQAVERLRTALEMPR